MQAIAASLHEQEQKEERQKKMYEAYNAPATKTYTSVYDSKEVLYSMNIILALLWH